MTTVSERLEKTEECLDRILSFIPPHLYVAAPVEEERKHYWMKPTETEKQLLKLKAKEGKRLRLDPTAGASNVQGLQKKQKVEAIEAGLHRAGQSEGIQLFTKKSHLKVSFQAIPFFDICKKLKN